MDALQTMKAELKMMRDENIYMKARLMAAETEFEGKKRVLSEYKAIEKLADDLLEVVMEAGRDDKVHENNFQGLDEETMKELIEAAVRDFTQALNQTESIGSRPAAGGNGGGYDGSTGGDDHSKEAGGSGYDSNGGNGGGHPE